MMSNLYYSIYNTIGVMLLLVNRISRLGVSSSDLCIMYVMYVYSNKLWIDIFDISVYDIALRYLILHFLFNVIYFLSHLIKTIDVTYFA